MKPSRRRYVSLVLFDDDGARWPFGSLWLREHPRLGGQYLAEDVPVLGSDPLDAASAVVRALGHRLTAPWEPTEYGAVAWVAPTPPRCAAQRARRQRRGAVGRQRR